MTLIEVAALVKTIFALLLIYQVKHWVADFPLQGKFMLGKFNADWSFFWPLAAHCAVHAAFDVVIVLAFGRPDLLWLAPMDFIIHFTMDRLKAGPKYLGRFKAFTKKEFMAEILPELQSGDKTRISAVMERIKSNTYFWWSLGIDQMTHHITHYLIIWYLAVPADIRALIL